jgi:hypothetical protein
MVVGKPLKKAWQRVVAAHCRLGKLKRLRAVKRGKGRVLRQSPPPASTAAAMRA